MIKITVSHLGLIDQADIELADLTIICGENNTGKTYITYLIYCLLTMWRHFIELDLQQPLKELRQQGIAKIDLQALVVGQWDILCTKALKRFENQFPEMAASKSDIYQGFRLSVEMPLRNKWKEKDYKRELRSAEGNLLVSMNKAAGITELEIAAPTQESSLPGMALIEFIEECVLDLILSDIVPDTFIVSTERTGATIFRRQLNLALSNIVELLTQAHRDGADSVKPHKVFETLYTRQDYALPVRRNVEYINQLPANNTDYGELSKQYPELLNEFESIAGGSYVTSKEGITYFQPKNTRLKLGLGEASSSVRSLLILWYWLRFDAKSGDMLMLDEPELNLHPSNQRRLARFLAQLVNHRVSVFITTHSDYIIKEFNTLIMLAQRKPHTEKVREAQGYKVDELLVPAKVALYMTGTKNEARQGRGKRARVNTLIPAKIYPDQGIEVTTFDTTIEEMNSIQSEILYGSEL